MPLPSDNQPLMLCGSRKISWFFMAEGYLVKQLNLQRAAALHQVHAAVSEQLRPGMVMRVSWQRLEEGVVKLNFDASFGSQMTVGVGMVVRDHEGLVLAAPYPMLAEDLAFLWAISLAS